MSEHELLWQMMQDQIKKIDNRLEQVQQSQAEQQSQLDLIDDHLHEFKDEQSALKQQMSQQFATLEKLIKSSVPDDDLEGHRLYHMGVKRRWNWMNDAKTTVLFKLIEVVAIAALLWTAANLWGGFKVAVGT